MKQVIMETGTPIKIWTNDIEDSALTQLKNLSRLPFIHKHVAAMPDVHYGIGATVGSVITTDKAIIPAAVGVDIGCFRGDATVQMLDGSSETFENLHRRDEPFWVFSVDPKGKIVPGKAVCVKTRLNAELIAVRTSWYNDVIYCTPDHEFMLKDGSYVEARYLVGQDLKAYPLGSSKSAEVVDEHAGYADVYCLQVEEYHNFALAAGVFVHNCGMSAVKTTLKASDLPDNLDQIRNQIERDIPLGAGVGHQGDRVRTGAWQEMVARYNRLIAAHPKLTSKNAHSQLGTLGSGNHFIEICLDEADSVWVMLHSGSRGVGNVIGRYFIEKAKRQMEKYYVTLPDQDLAFLPEDTQDFNDYMDALEWAQEYAYRNRGEMMSLTLAALRRYLPDFDLIEEAINCHHNYVSRENHYGKNVYLTRKGAIRAREGELGIIPGSMGTRSYIVRGKGNHESFCSCSHGAGRKMGRKEAARRFTVDDLAAQTSGISCRKDASVLDEIPAAYKDIDQVMENQMDLVEVVHTLRQVVCVKGG